MLEITQKICKLVAKEREREILGGKKKATCLKSGKAL